MAEKLNIYEACDKAIKAMNRENLEAFGKLKLANFDELNVIKTVTGVYKTSAKRAKKRYYEVAFEAFLLAMAMCGIPPKKAHQMAEKAITEEWVDVILTDTDPVTLYRFDTETERKAYRLAEALEVTTDKDYEINKALRFWSQQLGQYAINVTDYGVIEAFEEAGIRNVMWVTMHDERVCTECNSYDGKIFKLDEIPIKHWGCRCRLIKAD